MQIYQKSVALQLVALVALVAGSGQSSRAVNATWSDELILEPSSPRLDGTTWRNCDVPRWQFFCEASGDVAQIIALGGSGANSTWVMNPSDTRTGGITNWDGDEGPGTHVGPLVNYKNMTFQFRFKLTDWDPDASLDGQNEPGLFIDNNVWEISQEHFGAVRWNMAFGYERRPNNDFGFGPSFGKSMNLSYLGLDLVDQDPVVGGGHRNIKHADFPLVNDQWVVIRVVTDQTITGSETLTLFAGADEATLTQLGDPLDYPAGNGPNLFPTYAVDGGFKIVKNGAWAGVELDYLRAFRGVLTPSQSLTPTVDFNNDGTVDGADVAVVYNAWGTLSTANVANVTGDGNVDGADLAAVFDGWGTTDVAPVPEPTSIGLIALGLAIASLSQRR